MKAFVRVMSVALIVSMLAVMLVSCGGVPSGKYVAGDTTVTKSYTQYEFSGSKVTFTTYALGNKVDALSYEGKYKVKDGNITVGKYVENVAKSLGTDIKIAKFARLEKGEGLEKKEENFADEVAKMMGN